MHSKNLSSLLLGWIGVIIFNILIITDSYPAALVVFLFLIYQSYNLFQQRKAGNRVVLIRLSGDLLLSLLCMSLASMLLDTLSADQNTLLLYHPAACFIMAGSAYIIHKRFTIMEHKLPKIVKYR